MSGELWTKLTGKEFPDLSKMDPYHVYAIGHSLSLVQKHNPQEVMKSPDVLFAFVLKTSVGFGDDFIVGLTSDFVFIDHYLGTPEGKKILESLKQVH